MNCPIVWCSLGFPQDDNHPVVCIIWYDAQDYVKMALARLAVSFIYKLLYIH